MVTTRSGGRAATSSSQVVVSSPVEDRESRDPELDLRSLAPRFGALRDARTHAPVASRWAQRPRWVYLPVKQLAVDRVRAGRGRLSHIARSLPQGSRAFVVLGPPAQRTRAITEHVQGVTRQ